VATTSDPGHIFGPVFIPQCAAIRLVWTLINGKQATNVLHASYTTTPPNTQVFVNGLFTAISAHFTSSGLAAVVHTGVHLAFVGIRDMAEVPPAGSGVGHGEIVSNLAAVPGAAPAGDPLPANISFVVSLKTGLARQANRGRVYLTGFTEGGNDTGGNATTAVSAACTSFVSGISSDLTTNALTLAIAHPARKAYDNALGHPVPARNAGTVQVTNIVSLNNVWDSTRLRQLR
jgi:hypothetical protein